jgi:hypothetical protein
VRVDALFRLIVAIFIASIPLILAITRTARQRMRRAGGTGRKEESSRPENLGRREELDRRDEIDRHDEINRREEFNRRYERASRRDAEPGPRRDRPRPLAWLRDRLGAAINNITSGFDSAWRMDSDEDLRERDVRKRRDVRERVGAGAAARETAPAVRRRRETPIPETTYRGADIPGRGDSRSAERGAAQIGGRREEASPSRSQAVPGTPVSAALRALARVERRPVLQRAILYGEILGSPAGLRSPERSPARSPEEQQ